MKSKLMLIGITVITTTVAWIAVIAAFFWWTSRPLNSDERLLIEFHRTPGVLGVVGLPKSRAKPVTIVVEELWTGTKGTERLELARRPLEPQRSVLIGIRQLAD